MVRVQLDVMLEKSGLSRTMVGSRITASKVQQQSAVPLQAPQLNWGDPLPRDVAVVQPEAHVSRGTGVMCTMPGDHATSEW